MDEFDLAGMVFPCDASVQAKALKARLKVKMEDSRPWDREETVAMAELVALMDQYKLVDALRRAAEVLGEAEKGD